MKKDTDFQEEFAKAVREVSESIDSFFDTDVPEDTLLGTILKAKFSSELNSGAKYLEKVDVRKRGESGHEGTVYINPLGDKEAPTKFVYEHTASKFRKLVGPTGKLLKGKTKEMTAEYLAGAVPYAIMCLDRQIKAGGERQGEFFIPRTYNASGGK